MSENLYEKYLRLKQELKNSYGKQKEIAEREVQQIEYLMELKTLARLTKI
jgi:Mn-dependent DtxR family transcriptional regulator